MTDPKRCKQDGLLPKLKLINDLIGSHNGAVEFMTNIGDALLTSGGNDGKLIMRDVNTGSKLGFLDCHPGVHIAGVKQKLKSCVVEVFLNGKDGRLISLCRDGVLQQWMFALV